MIPPVTCSGNVCNKYYQEKRKYICKHLKMKAYTFYMIIYCLLIYLFIFSSRAELQAITVTFFYNYIITHFITLRYGKPKNQRTLTGL